MTPQPVFSVYAFNKDDDTTEYRRKEPLWRVEDAVRHALTRGFDTILIEQLQGETQAFTSPRSVLVDHVWHG